MCTCVEREGKRSALMFENDDECGFVVGVVWLLSWSRCSMWNDRKKSY